jgi:hypothetical protein
MAISVLRGRFRAPKTTVEDEADQLAIGEQDQEIFSCPICSRPLASGARRCPGCQTRLLMGMPLRRVSGFVALGTIGTIALAMTAVTTISVVQAFASRGSGVDTLPTAAPSTPIVVPAFVPPAVGVPFKVRVALDQSIAINVRMAAVTPKLRAELARPNLDSGTVAELLRDLGADATFGADLVTRVDDWSEAGYVAADLDLLYADVRSIAGSGLAASLTNDRAYRTAAQRMVAVLRRIHIVNSGIQTLATSAGITLPSMPRPASPAPAG